MSNPFRPGAGVVPVCVARKEEALGEFEKVFAPGGGYRGTNMLAVGHVGAGKSVLLGEYARVAREAGWVVIAEKADAGLMQRLAEEHLPGIARRLDRFGFTRWRANYAAGPAGWAENYPYLSKAVSEQIEQFSRLLLKRRSGLVIAVDDVHLADRESFIALDNISDFLRRESGKAVAVGATCDVSKWWGLYREDFIYRTKRYWSCGISAGEVARAMGETVAGSGRVFDADGLAVAVEAACGYPLLIQLVGFHAWEQSPDSPVIGVEDVRAGVQKAIADYHQTVLDPLLNPLSDGAKAFLLEMADYDGPVHPATIADKHNVSIWDIKPHYSLLDTQRIITNDDGYVELALPYVGEWVRERAGCDLAQVLAADRV